MPEIEHEHVRGKRLTRRQHRIRILKEAVVFMVLIGSIWSASIVRKAKHGHIEWADFLYFTPETLIRVVGGVLGYGALHQVWQQREVDAPFWKKIIMAALAGRGLREDG